MDTLTPGDPVRVGGFRVTGRLGRGGQGVVYLGESQSGEPVAIKVLYAGFGDDRQARRYFSRELSLARKVAGFCTARILAADIEGDVPYIVSEYVPGRSLQDAVRQDGPMTGTELDRLAIGTITALAAIHRAGVVHRDFKPGNVLLGPDGPRVIDFGIARALDTPSATVSRTVGTPAYMAPEQITGERAGAPVDIFAWACLMAYASTGQPPFGADGVAPVFNRTLHQEPRLHGIDSPLRETLAQCLAKDPRYRPTAEQVLSRLLGAEGQTATAMFQTSGARTVIDAPTMPPPLPRPWQGFARGVGALVVTAALLGLSALVFGPARLSVVQNAVDVVTYAVIMVTVFLIARRGLGLWLVPMPVVVAANLGFWWLNEGSTGGDLSRTAFLTLPFALAAGWTAGLAVQAAVRRDRFDLVAGGVVAAAYGLWTAIDLSALQAQTTSSGAGGQDGVLIGALQFLLGAVTGAVATLPMALYTRFHRR